MAAGIAQGLISSALGGMEIASGVLGIVAGDKSAHAAEEAAQEAALIYRERAAVQASLLRRQARRERGYQRSQVARSGISLRGSQMDLLVSNAYEAELEAVMVERFGADSAQQQYGVARSAARQGQYGRAAGIIDVSRLALQASSGLLGAGETSTGGSASSGGGGG